MPVSKRKHLTLAGRSQVESRLNQGESPAQIACTLGMSRSSITREIHKHVQTLPAARRKTQTHFGTYDCAFLEECGTHKTFCRDYQSCPKHTPSPCTYRDSHGFCNGCPDTHPSHCKLTRKVYCAKDAQLEYERTLSTSRSGINLTEEELKDLSEYLAPCIKNGQSPSVVLMNHPECPVCSRTIYNYITERKFAEDEVLDIDLPQKTRRRARKRWKVKDKMKTKKRKDNSFLKGRTYDQYLEYLEAHPEVIPWQMDTVYNRQNGPYIQTFIMDGYPSLFLALYHEEKTAEAMYQGLKRIHGKLGEETFRHLFPVILTDRGSEFSAAEKMETLGCKIFFCDPMQSTQKPKIENKHLLLRRIVPKEADFSDLGLDCQESLDLAVNHINSYPVKSLQGKTPFECFSFLYGPHLLANLGVKPIGKDEVRLKPDLFKR